MSHDFLEVEGVVDDVDAVEDDFDDVFRPISQTVEAKVEGVVDDVDDVHGDVDDVYRPISQAVEENLVYA